MFITPAYAQAASGAAPGGGASFFLQIAPLALVFLIFWFLVLRPQQQKVKAHRALIDAVKRGDTVVTGGGLVGKVTKVDGDTVEVEIAPNVRVKAMKATLSDVTQPGGKAAND